LHARPYSARGSNKPQRNRCRRLVSLRVDGILPRFVIFAAVHSGPELTNRSGYAATGAWCESQRPIVDMKPACSSRKTV